MIRFDGIASVVSLQVRAFTGLTWREGEDGERTLYVAAAPHDVSTSWKGGAIYISADGGESWDAAGQVSRRGIIGRATSADETLSVVTTESWDASSSLFVSVPGGDLSSQSENDAREANGNVLLVGNEVLAFQNAEAVTVADYVLSGFQRALVGTDGYGHTIVEDVTGLNDAVVSVPLTERQSGADLLVAVVAAGQTLDAATRVPVSVPRIPDGGSGGGGGSPPTPRDISTAKCGDGVRFYWSPGPSVDDDCFQIRAGANWLGARVVYAGKCDRPCIPIIGTDPRDYTIRQRNRYGLWSPSAPVINHVPVSDCRRMVTQNYTGSGVSWTGTMGTELSTDSDEGMRFDPSGSDLTGQFDSAVIDAGEIANWQWLVEVDTHEQDLRGIDDLPSFRLDSTEARIWTFEGREPSANAPGADLDTAWDDYLGSIDELSAQGLHLYGWEGDYGENTRLEVQARYDSDGLGTWSDWAAYQPTRVRAQRIQVRLLFKRWSTSFQRYATRLRVEVSN